MTVETNPDWIRAIEDYRVAAERLVQALSVPFMRDSTLEEFLHKTQICLLDVYKSALALPRVSAKSSEIEDGKIPPDESMKLFHTIHDKLGKYDVHWEIFDSTAADPDPYQANISQDLAEIYEDVKKSLLIIEKNPLSANLLWELRFNCTSHWGRHLTSALRSIYCLQMT